jgi:titin
MIVDVSKQGVDGFADPSSVTYSLEGHKGGDVEIEITSLVHGSTYRFRCSAKNSAGAGPYGDYSVNSRTLSKVPSQPGKVSSTSSGVGTTSIEIGFSRPSDTSSEDVLWYKIFVEKSVGGGKYEGLNPVIISGSQSSAVSTTIDNLQKGTVYRFSVAAENSVGYGSAGPWSADITTHITSPSSPGQPAAAKSGIKASSVEVEFDVPSDTGGASISLYRLEVERDSGFGFSSSGLTPTTADPSSKDVVENGKVSILVESLLGGSSYRFRASAKNVVGYGTSSAWSDTVTTTAKEPDVPSDVAIVAGSIQSTSMTVAVSSPSHDGGAAVSDVEIDIEEVTLGGKFKSLETVSASWNSGKVVVKDLEPGREYRFRARVKNEVGWSDFSQWSQGSSTLSVAPGAPRSLSVEDIKADSFAVSFLPPTSDGGSLLTEYVLTVESRISASQYSVLKTVKSDAPGGDGSVDVVISGLRRGTSYRVRVAAVNTKGTGPSTNWTDDVKTTSLVPGAPGVPEASSSDVEATSVTLTFTPPQDNGGEVITEFIVLSERDKGNGKYEVVKSVSGTPSGGAKDSVKITGLDKGSVFRFRVLAENSVGRSPYSEWSALIRTLYTAPAACSAPIVSSVKSTTLKLAVDPPSDTGGSVISSFILKYEIQSLSSNGFSEFLSKDISYAGDSGGISVDIDNLIGGRTYRFRVAATNSAGQGPFSVYTNSIKTTSIAPASPGAPSIVAVAWNSVNATFSASIYNGGEAITVYEI